MAEQKDPEVIQLDKHNEAITTSITTSSENDLKTGRKDIPPQREDYVKKGRRGRDAAGNQIPSKTNHKQENTPSTKK